MSTIQNTVVIPTTEYWDDVIAPIEIGGWIYIPFDKARIVANRVSLDKKAKKRFKLTYNGVEEGKAKEIRLDDMEEKKASAIPK